MSEGRGLLVGREVEAVNLRSDTRDVVLGISSSAIALEVINIGTGDDGWLLWTARGIRVAVKSNGDLGSWAE